MSCETKRVNTRQTAIRSSSWHTQYYRTSTYDPIESSGAGMRLLQPLAARAGVPYIDLHAPLRPGRAVTCGAAWAAGDLGLTLMTAAAPLLARMT